MFDDRNNLVRPGRGRRARAFRRQGLRHRDPAQRARLRGAVATASRCCSTICAARAPQAYIHLASEVLRRERGSRGSEPDDAERTARRGLGRGLRRCWARIAAPSAPSRASGRRAARTVAVEPAPCAGRQFSRAGASTRRRWRRWPIDPRRGRAAADPGAPASRARRQLRDHRRRAALAGGAARAAARGAGVVRELGDREALEIALVENVQREDLTPLEEARAIAA